MIVAHNHKEDDAVRGLVATGQWYTVGLRHEVL